MTLNLHYKVQIFDKTAGFWKTLFIYPQYEYDLACKRLYAESKLDNSRQYRLIQLKEELIDELFPPGS